MQVELVHVSAKGRVEPRTLSKGEHVLGRQPGCAMRVPSSEVSRQHCVFTVSDGGVRVRDLDSSNGTWVNAERVTETRLVGGDLVAVGPLVFVVRIDGEPETIDPVLLFEQGRPRAESTPGLDSGPSARSGSAPSVGGIPPLSGDPGGSSIIEFDFDLSDDEDDQPPL